MQNLSSQSLARSVSTGCDVHVPRLNKRPESITFCRLWSICPATPTAARVKMKTKLQFIGFFFFRYLSIFSLILSIFSTILCVFYSMQFFHLFWIFFICFRFIFFIFSLFFSFTNIFCPFYFKMCFNVIVRLIFEVKTPIQLFQWQFLYTQRLSRKRKAHNAFDENHLN